MLKKTFSLFLFVVAAIGAMAQTNVKAVWSLTDLSDLSKAEVTGSGASLVTPSYLLGSNLTANGQLTKSGADTNFTAVDYTPAFATFQPSANVSSATSGHNIAVGLTPQAGHKFKPTKISFDAAKCGTDKGGIIVKIKESGGAEKELETAQVLRNKIMTGNTTGYSHHEYYINDYNLDKGFIVLLYVVNIDNTKTMALRNITVEGEMDSKIFTASDFVTGMTFSGKKGSGDAETISILDLIKDMNNGDNVRYTTKLYADPTDIKVNTTAGYTADVKYADNSATVTILEGSEKHFSFTVSFTISNIPPKGDAKPLGRGLMALSLSGAGAGSGNLVSWRAFAGDDRNLKFKLFRGTNATTQTTKLNSGNYISGKTNFLDTSGTTGSYYKLQVFDANNNLIETVVSEKTWANQTKQITLEGGAPTDIWGRGATYTPNDASICDMDGDGEYEIILKWSPSNEKDAASSGTTSPEYYGCYKLSGKRLWILTGGPNMFSSAHTSPFVAWDLDGDGFGEFMIKTAPGAIDGEGNYLSLDTNPKANHLSGRGKQDNGPEWITVFDGRNGAELKTINYHTNYADESTSFWGDSNQNRSERYLACIAWLDGEDKNPSAIFARGYYSGAKIGAYDWDGENITLRWLHRAASATSGTVKYADGTTKTLTKTVYGDGAHWISVCDVDGDGKQEITYGSSALDHDGTTLYRTGLGHGDALHISDFDPERPGLECFMAHEHSPYGVDYRDAATGKILLRKTAGGDTGRGFMANFDPEREGPIWQASAWGNLFDKDGNSVVDNCTHGGGAGIQDRVYWTGTLADDFWGKGVIESWNGTTLGRVLPAVNNTNYTSGNTNNDSKNNACLIADILGDWREEIILWTGDAASGFKLVINSTNHQTDYTVPHLMDDYGYRAQVIAQNDCYNQPPHLSYNLRHSKKLTRHPQAIENTSGAQVGKNWDSFFATYPVIIPEGITAYAVKSRSTSTETLTLTALKAGTVMPANSGIIYTTDLDEVTFVPTAKAGNSAVTTTYLKGAYADSTLVETSSRAFYEFRIGDRGLGFYKANGKKVAGNTGFLTFTQTTTSPGAYSYVLTEDLNPVKATETEGDVNSDGNVDYHDINAVISVITGGTPNPRADVNKDTKTDIHDVNAVISVITNKK